MNGADSLIHTARRAGVELCLANPGTTEMPLVAALDRVPGMRAVLGLFEGVCTGAADGYARMSGRPALTLLHLGPGFANGLANLHNARRARSPVVNLVGDQATWHLAADAPLTSDIAGLARTIGWVRETRSAAALAQDTADAIAASLAPPGGIATLVVPADCQWEEARGPATPLPRASRAAAPEAQLAAAARAAARGAECALLLGAGALSAHGLAAAQRIADTTKCRVFSEGFAARIERGAGLPDFPRLPYFPEQVVEALKGVRALVLAGARAPVAFFGYPGMPSTLTPEGAETTVLATPAHDVEAALEALADRLGAARAGPAIASRTRPAAPSGELTPVSLGQAIAALQPEHAIVVDEAATSGLPWSGFSAAAPPHTVLSLTGGAIGQGLPCALGAALACPDRRVIAFQADGSGLYTLQALWTLAREGCDVVVVICANRRYRILQVELARAGIAEPGPNARSLTDLGSPNIDWVAAARGFGVPAVSVSEAGAFASAFARALATPGPQLIEAVLA